MTAYRVGFGTITRTDRGEGLDGLYAATSCTMVEVAARGNLGGVPVVLLCDEEGLYADMVRTNLTACDLRAEMTKTAPHPSLVGLCSLVYDDTDLRGFTDEEAAKIERAFRHGGYPFEE